MKFLNMMNKFYTRQEAAPAPEAGGGGGGLTPPPMNPAPAPAPAPAAAPPAAVDVPVVDVPPVAAPATVDTPAQFAPITEEKQNNVMNYVLKAGLQLEHVEQEMAAYGKLSDVTISILKNAHGEHADLVIGGIEQMHTQHQAEQQQASQQTYNEVAELLGVDQAQGSAEFGKMIDWLGKSEFAAQGGELADMIESGGLSRTLALQAMTANYRAGAQPDLVTGEPPAPTGNSQMTMAEYNRQLPELKAKYGYDSPQVKALQAQRNAARNAGIN